MYETKLIPAYCHLCLLNHLCDFDFKYDIQNKDHHGQCPNFVLTVGRLSADQFADFEQFYNQQYQWSRQLEIEFAKNLVNSPDYRLQTILEDSF